MDGPASEQAFFRILYMLYTIENLLRTQQGSRRLSSGPKDIPGVDEAIRFGEDGSDDGQKGLGTSPSDDALVLFRTSRLRTYVDSIGEDSASEKSQFDIPQENHQIVTDVTKLLRYNTVVGCGSKIPSDGRLPLPFSQNYLERLPQEHISRILDALEMQNKLISNIRARSDKMGRAAVTFDILDYYLDPAVDILEEEYQDDQPQYIEASEGKSCSVQYFQSSRLAPSISQSWSRIILCEGLSQFGLSNNSVQAAELCPLLFADFSNPPETDHIIDDTFRHKTGRVVDMLVQHMLCSKGNRLNRINSEVATSFHPLFQATFFMPVQKECDKVEVKSPLGLGSESKDQRFRQACVTVLISENYSVEKKGSPSDFTILILAPSYFFERGCAGDSAETRSCCQPLRYNSSRFSPFNDFQDAKIQIVSHVYNIIETHCRELLSHVLQQCGNDGDISFLDGDEYVDLLYEDTAFRKPSIYAWAVVCLGSLEQNISDLLSELILFRGEVTTHNSNQELRLQQYYDAAMKTSQFVSYAKFMEIKGDEVRSRAYQCANIQINELDNTIQRLRVVQAQVLQKRDEFKALRDGLFSANSVIEARRSRIVAEHVRLLTLVSIFFAPLSFCVSLWSLPLVSERHKDLTTPIFVTAIVSVTSYFIVFNLKLVICTFRPLFDGVRDSCIRAMSGEQEIPLDQADVDKSRLFSVDWRKKAKELEVFPKKDTNPQPTEWWFFIYGLYLFWGKVLDTMRWIKAGLHSLVRLRVVVRENPQRHDRPIEA